jgi:hypothetical protein
MILPSYNSGNAMGLAGMLQQNRAQHVDNVMRQRTLDDQRKARGIEQFMGAMGQLGGAMRDTRDFKYQQKRDASDDAFRGQAFNENVRQFGVGQENWNKAFGREGDWRGQDVGFRDKAFEAERGDRAQDVGFRERSYVDSRGDTAEDRKMAAEEAAFRKTDAERRFDLDRLRVGIGEGQFDRNERLALLSQLDPEQQKAVAAEILKQSVSGLGGLKTPSVMPQIPGIMGQQIPGVTPAAPTTGTSGIGDILSNALQEGAGKKAADKAALLTSIIEGAENAGPGLQDFINNVQYPDGLAPQEGLDLDRFLRAMAQMQGNVSEMEALKMGSEGDPGMDALAEEGAEGMMPGLIRSAVMGSSGPAKLAVGLGKMLTGYDPAAYRPSEEYLRKTKEKMTRWNALKKSQDALRGEQKSYRSKYGIK